MQGEVSSIESLEDEWAEVANDAIGTILVGDLNIHHKKWLKYSNRNSAEGELLYKFCSDHGMQQVVWKATRGDYLLDLVITDIDDVKTNVLPKIAGAMAAPIAKAM